MTISPFEMMKRISSLEKNLDVLSKKAEETIITGESGAGMVKVTINADGIINDLYIADEVFAMNDKGTLTTLIKSAVNNATEKKKELVKDLISKAAQGDLHERY